MQTCTQSSVLGTSTSNPGARTRPELRACASHPDLSTPPAPRWGLWLRPHDHSSTLLPEGLHPHPALGTQPTPALSPTSKLYHLEYLDLSHNRLASVPARLPRTLAVLHLGRNRIRCVEAARLRGARGLRYLLLQHNQLGATGLPAGALRPLRGLHTLHLYGNRLARVPLALPRRLRALVLPHNHVTALGARDLAGMPGLAELNLAYNRLVSARVHRRAFRPLRALRSLDLAGNQLTRLPSGLPGGLHTLRLQRNEMRALEPEPLAGLAQLRELSLAHNRLRVGDIGPGTWHELQALQVRRGAGKPHRPHGPSPPPPAPTPRLVASSLMALRDFEEPSERAWGLAGRSGLQALGCALPVTQPLRLPRENTAPLAPHRRLMHSLGHLWVQALF